MSKTPQEQFSYIVEAASAIQELKDLFKSDPEMVKLKKTDKLNFLDEFYKKYEKEISTIEKKYNMSMDQLGKALLKV